jgi:hypothetical protein
MYSIWSIFAIASAKDGFTASKKAWCLSLITTWSGQSGSRCTLIAPRALMVWAASRTSPGSTAVMGTLPMTEKMFFCS